MSATAGVFPMTVNRAKQRLNTGGLAIGMMVFEFSTPGAPWILSSAGLDFVVFDMEGTGLELETVRVLSMTSHAAGIVPLVRVPEASSRDIGRCLDLGIMGLMAPKVDTADQAREFVDAAKFPPVGGRSSGYGLFRDAYISSDPASDMSRMNDEILLILQIESRRGVASVEEIASIEGVDVLTVGMNDLTADMGIPGRFEAPSVRESVTRVREACIAHGKVFGARGPRQRQVAEGLARLDDGHRLLLTENDITMFGEATKAYVDLIRNASFSQLAPFANPDRVDGE